MTPENRPVRPTPPTQAGPVRRLVHLLIALAGWVLFVYWWWLVFHRLDPRQVRFTVIFILGTLVVCVGLTGLWAAHNIGIFKRRGPRLKVREARHDFARDRLGRSVSFTGGLERLREEPIVHIRLEHQGKVYRPSADVRIVGQVLNLPERARGSEPA